MDLFLSNKRPPAQQNATLPERSSTVALVNFGSNDLLQAVFQASAAYATTNDTTVLHDVVSRSQGVAFSGVGLGARGCGVADQQKRAAPWGIYYISRGRGWSAGSPATHRPPLSVAARQARVTSAPNQAGKVGRAQRPMGKPAL